MGMGPLPDLLASYLSVPPVTHLDTINLTLEILKEKAKAIG